jgi:glutamate synthase (NADPH/NADH) large chain
VVEGVGDHGCEYMTGGVVVVIGPTGKNFAAGMSGGIAYVYNPEGDFQRLLNPGMVDVDPMEKFDFDLVRALVRNHFSYTSSEQAQNILLKWKTAREHFVKVMPRDYKAVLERRKMKPAVQIKVAAASA